MYWAAPESGPSPLCPQPSRASSSPPRPGVEAQILPSAPQGPPRPVPVPSPPSRPPSLPLPRSAPTTQAPGLFLPHTRQGPASGPWPMPRPLPGMLSPSELHTAYPSTMSLLKCHLHQEAPDQGPPSSLQSLGTDAQNGPCSALNPWSWRSETRIGV